MPVWHLPAVVVDRRKLLILVERLVARVGARVQHPRDLLVCIYTNKKFRLVTHLGNWAMDRRCSRISMIVEFTFKLFRRERRQSIDITDICFFDIRPYMEQIRLGVPEICFTTHGRSHVFQTVRETVDQRTTYKNELYVKGDAWKADTELTLPWTRRI